VPNNGLVRPVAQTRPQMGRVNRAMMVMRHKKINGAIPPYPAMLISV